MESEEVINRIFAISAVIVTSGLGLLINAYALFALLKTKIFGAAFGRICVSQCLANIGQMILFFCFICPMVLFDMKLFSTYLGGRPGQLLNFFWYSCILSHLLSSVNRLVYITFPLKYKRIFSQQRTTVFLVIGWVVSFLLITPQFNNDCLMVFVERDISFDFQDTNCGRVQATFVDFTLSVSVISVIIVVDVATSMKIYRIKKYTSTTNKVQQKQIRFFFQTCTEEIVLLCCVLSFYKVAEFFNDWLKFVFTTWMWTFTHAVDGVIILLFNRELCWRKIGLFKKVIPTPKMPVFILNARANHVRPPTRSKLVYSTR